MAEPKVCGEQEIINNAAATMAATNNRYGPVEIMVIARALDSNGTWTIVFSVPGSGASYQAEWGNLADMWAPCPSTLPSNATVGASGQPPEPGAYGTLYLSEQFLAANQIVAEPKWPLRLPLTGPPGRELEIYPLKLELTGLEMKSGQLRKASIDLLDARLAARR